MMKRPVSIIGSTEKVDFPELGLLSVPAKTDTGADSSAIWASHAEVMPDGLQFMLFGPGSQFYSGTPVLATVYRTTSVKNSFGEAEFRYKVRLLLRVEGRAVRAWFTLSDRAGMRYPVLLGRRLLKNKFLVDVSRSQTPQAKAGVKRVLLLTGKTDELESYAAEVQLMMKTRAELTVRSFGQLSFEIQTGKVRARETITGHDLADFDLVYFKSHKTSYEPAIATVRYLTYKHVPFFDQELSNHVSYDKLSEQVLLALHNLPVAPSLCASGEQLKRQFATVSKQWGLPLVCKEINADRGRKNFLVHNAKELNEVLQGAEAHDLYLLQQFIPNDGYLRMLVFGAEVGPVIRRTATHHADPLKAHLNNPAGSANASLVEAEDVPSAAYDVAMRAARLMGRQVAGVDLIQHQQTRQWLVLEVNNAPQLRSGSFIPEKKQALARFLDFELNR